MYVFNLCPFPVKRTSQLYAWMSIPAVKEFPHNEIIFIGAEWQLRQPNTIVHADWVYGLAGRSEYVDDWDDILKFSPPSELVENITNRFDNPLTLLREMICTGFYEYKVWLFDALEKFRGKIKALITFVNCKSTEEVCAQLRIPVIHMEAGFMRPPVWKISSFQFDFCGVNGGSEAYERFTTSMFESYKRFSPSEIVSMLLSKDLVQFFRPFGPDAYEFGVPLQVEDDSNLVAFSNGVSNLDALYIARQIFPPNKILARNHPLSLMNLKEHPNISKVDCSQNSVEFISLCKRILTINSSVAFESMLMGRQTYVLGESPLAPVAHRSVDRHLRGELCIKPNLDAYLDFIALNYLIPRELWMKKPYIDFRIARPTERQIREHHIAAIRAELDEPTAFS